ncbi:MAG: O-antigen ligase family protein [Calditrichia bacterium]
MTQQNLFFSPAVTAVLVVLQLVIALLTIQYGVIIPAGLVAAGMLLYAFHNTFFGICLTILVHAFLHSTETVNPLELYFGASYVATIAGWLIQSIFYRQKKQVHSIPEGALALFLLICFASLPISIMHGVPPLFWFRQLIPFLTYLLFFPLVQELNSRKRLNILLLCIVVVMILTGINTLLRYKAALESVTKLWEVLASRKTGNEPYFFVGSVSFATLFIYYSDLKRRLAFGILTAFFLVTLVVTFSRGYWVTALLALFIIFVLVKPQLKMRMASYSIIGVLFAGLLASILFGNFAESIILQVGSRFSSLGQTRKDGSVQERIAETVAVWEQIVQSPVVGHGIGAEFSYDSVINRQRITGPYVHNAYLSLVFKFGLIGLISYLIFYLGMLRVAYITLMSLNNRRDWILLVIIFALLVAIIPLSISSPQLTQKNSILLITIMLSIISYFYNTAPDNTSNSGTDVR